MPRRVAVIAMLVACVVASEGRALACAGLRATSHIDQFSCGSCGASDGNLETLITEVTGTVSVFNGHASPTLTSVAVELQARPAGTSLYHPVARQVISAGGTEYPPARIVQTCDGPLTSGSTAGRIRFVDVNEKPLTFDDVKTIPLGTTTLHFIATFAGSMPDLAPGAHARVKITTTAMNTDGVHPCSIDADGDGVTDANVKTLNFLNRVRVPTTAFLVNP